MLFFLTFSGANGRLIRKVATWVTRADRLLLMFSKARWTAPRCSEKACACSVEMQRLFLTLSILEFATLAL